jgi:hypothetical protein
MVIYYNGTETNVEIRNNISMEGPLVSFLRIREQSIHVLVRGTFEFKRRADKIM